MARFRREFPFASAAGDRLPRARISAIFRAYMGLFYSLLFPWGLILQGIAIVHFIRRRPDTYWLWIVLFGGGLGAIVYILVVVLPYAGLLRQSLKTFPR